MLTIEPIPAFNDNCTWLLHDSSHRSHEYRHANVRFTPAVKPDNRAVTERARAAARQRALTEFTAASSPALERPTNPFLRCAEPALVAALKRQGKWQGDTPRAVFPALRSWKD